MENERKSTGNTAETVTISRAEYEALKEQNAELSQQVQWLMDQMRLASLPWVKRCIIFWNSDRA